jgi:hypothetical protein
MKAIYENIVIVIVQLLILNHFSISDLLVPQIAFVLILTLPVHWKLSVQLISAFGLGLLLDFFTSTPGIQISSLLFIPVIRTWLFRLYDLEELFLNKSRFHLKTVKFSIFISVLTISGFFYHLYMFSLLHFTSLKSLDFWLTIFLSFTTAISFILVIQFIFSQGE